MSPGNGPSMSDILKQIADAMCVLDSADAAFQGVAPDAAELYDSVDRAPGEILRRICTLTDEQADSVEPALSRLEIRLFHNRRSPQS